LTDLGTVVDTVLERVVMTTKRTSRSTFDVTIFASVHSQMYNVTPIKHVRGKEQEAQLMLTNPRDAFTAGMVSY